MNMYVFIDTSICKWYFDPKVRLMVFPGQIFVWAVTIYKKKICVWFLFLFLFFIIIFFLCVSLSMSSVDTWFLCKLTWILGGWSFFLFYNKVSNLEREVAFVFGGYGPNCIRIRDQKQTFHIIGMSTFFYNFLYHSG